MLPIAGYRRPVCITTPGTPSSPERRTKDTDPLHPAGRLVAFSRWTWRRWQRQTPGDGESDPLCCCGRPAAWERTSWAGEVRISHPWHTMFTVYLDQNKWIDLARAAAGHPHGERYHDTLRQLRQAVFEGRAKFALSCVHYFETARAGDPNGAPTSPPSCSISPAQRLSLRPT